MNELDDLSIKTIRSLVIDVTNKANSGHPGMAIGSAPILYTLWKNHLVVNPNEPNWINRDRFVLSAGHVSALLYTMLHLSGYKVSLEDLKSFRQLGSITPGHPEFGMTPGVDATAGPLGQGIAQAVGMAIAEASLKHNYPEGNKLIDHYTYVLCGDGCLQEGVSQEAISLAGHLKLNKLILFYDCNNVTLDGPLSLSFSENVKGRFLASNWNVMEVENGEDIDEIDYAIKKAKVSPEKPSVIIVKTVIGYGSKNAGTNKVHGSPLGEEDGAYTKRESYHFVHSDFYIPHEVETVFETSIKERGVKAYQEWNEKVKAYGNKYPNELKRFQNCLSFDTSAYLPRALPRFKNDNKVATRNASGACLNAMMLSLPNLIGGSADVAGSVMTKLENGIDFTPKSYEGHNINWGIREFAMGCAQNGILLHGGLRTYAGCFFVFSDYMKPAIRLACISKLPAIYLFSHDSIALGEDGTTHQPVEHLAMLRSLPNIHVFRPCDERETYAAWLLALESTQTPTALILSRQKLPTIAGTSLNGVRHGAYVVSKAKGEPQFELIATGSEVSLAIEVQTKLLEKGIDVSVISMPSWEVFEEQDNRYKKSVFTLPKSKRISMEMLSTFGWAKYADTNIGIDEYGVSAPQKDIIKKFNFTSDQIVEKIIKM